MKGNISNAIKVQRLTALWALSEAALGGVLHALKVPLTGLIIGGAAVIFISLIAFYSERRITILKSTLVVILVKFVVSPHTPINAYFAVLLQGMIGYFIFINKNFYFLSAVTLGTIAASLSGMQKLITLTIFFGKTLWDSIEIFFDYVLSLFPFQQIVEQNFNFSYILIFSYIGFHFFAGLIIGFIAAKLPQWLSFENFDENLEVNFFSAPSAKMNQKRKKKKWWQRPGMIFLLIIVITLLVISYLNSDSSMFKSIIFMLLRSIVLMILWYFFLAPIIGKAFRSFLSSKKNSRSLEVEQIIGSFPELRAMIYHSWKYSSKDTGLLRLKSFITSTFFILLNTDLLDNN